MNDTAQTYASKRDRHLFGPGPKHILSLDGGGVRGAITVAFLERIERLLKKRYGDDVRLGDHFDLIGGTSTGAIISGALALGFQAAQIKDFYTKLAPLAFRRRFAMLPVLQAKFDAGGLRKEIQNIVEDRTLSSEDLITGLCVVAKRIDTGSPWIVANNPKAMYWNDGPQHEWSGNKDYKLSTLVRASTAAPHFFDPEVLPIVAAGEPPPASKFDLPTAGQTPLGRWLLALMARLGFVRTPFMDAKTQGLFVDGGVTPHNNPSFALLQMAILKPFHLDWKTGPDNLSVTSIGTGTYRPRLAFNSLGFAWVPKLALHSLMSMMSDAEMMILAQMQWLGECPDPWPINSEIGTLAGDGPPGGKMFHFLRYDVKLEQDWLKEKLDINVSKKDVERYRCMDEPQIVDDIYAIATKAAEQQVKPEHWLAPAKS